MKKVINGKTYELTEGTCKNCDIFNGCTVVIGFECLDENNIDKVWKEVTDEKND